MTIEAYTNGKETLFRERMPGGAAIAKTPPTCGLGAKQLAWIAARGWLAGPRVERKETA